METKFKQMKKLFILFFLSATALTASAQKQAVLELLKKHQIDAAILEQQNKPPLDDHSFNLKYTSVTQNKEVISLAQYDPSKPEADRWTVISVKGKAPSKSEIKTFIKTHTKLPVSPKIDDASFLVEKETPDYLIVSYKQDPASMPAEAKFMKDCRQHMTINLKTKRLEKIQSLNEKPLKIKIFNAEKLDLTIKFTWNEQEQRYFIESEDLNLIVKFLGQLAPMETISEYSNYKKVL